MLKSPAGIILHLLAALLVGAAAGYATAHGWIPWVLAVAIGALAGASVGLTIAQVRRERLAGVSAGEKGELLMAELKTKATATDVQAFIEGIEDEGQRRDAQQLVRIMQRVTGEKPAMWGDSIVGFGRYHYRYESGREGDWFLTGFSPRKRDLTLYIMAGFDRWDELMERLGKHKTGKSCLYVRRLEDVDAKVLAELIEASVDQMKRTYPD